MNRVFVTGASGFVGSSLIATLLSDSEVEAIVCVVRSEKSIEKLHKALCSIGANHKSHKLNITQCSLTNFELLTELMEGCDTLIHAAAEVDLSKKGGEDMIAQNLYSTECAVTAAIDCNVNHIIHISSIAALEGGTIDEKATELSHIKNIDSKSPYAISKFFSENAAWRAINSGIKVSILMPAVIIGDGLGIYKGSAQLTKIFTTKQPFYTLGVKGYVMKDDVVDAIIALLHQSNNKSSNRYILCSENLSYKELQHRLSESEPKIKVANWVINFAKSVLKTAAKLGLKFKISDNMLSSLTTSQYYDGSKIIKELGFKYRKITSTKRSI